eukprot:Skav219320  [mRNA]  locus=scaffold1957:71624:71938:- [translate_table: standard]
MSGDRPSSNTVPLLLESLSVKPPAAEPAAPEPATLLERAETFEDWFAAHACPAGRGRCTQQAEGIQVGEVPEVPMRSVAPCVQCPKRPLSRTQSLSHLQPVVED